MKSIVLLSGGLDSAVSLKRAWDETQVVLSLTFHYGQKAADREIGAAREMCRRFRVKHQVVPLDWLAAITQTALVSAEKEILRPQNLDQAESVQAVWVPNRNGILINIAAGFAETLDCDLIVTGFNAEEAAIFPDNRPEFVAAVNASLQLSTLRHPQVISYTQDLTKTEIVRLGREIEAPIDLVWSCYLGGKEQCGRCDPCLRLQRALRDAGCWDWYRSQKQSVDSEKGKR